MLQNTCQDDRISVLGMPRKSVIKKISVPGMTWKSVTTSPQHQFCFDKVTLCQETRLVPIITRVEHGKIQGIDPQYNVNQNIRNIISYLVLLHFVSLYAYMHAVVYHKWRMINKVPTGTLSRVANLQGETHCWVMTEPQGWNDDCHSLIQCNITICKDNSIQ